MSRERSRLMANRQITDEAAEWFIEFNGGEVDQETRERFDAWLRRSPEHLSAYLQMVPIWAAAAELERDRRRTPEQLVAWALEDRNVVPLGLPRHDAAPARRELETNGSGASTSAPRRYVLTITASLVVLCLVVVIGIWWSSHSGVYETGIGEQRRITLSDGSTVELNSNSIARVHYSDRRREIVLLAGQALFRVAKDATRPFAVKSADVTVLAIGTQFDVYRKRSGTVVTVVEGSVAVVPQEGLGSARPEGAGSSGLSRRAVVVSAGQQTVIGSAPTGERASTTVVNVAQVIGWTEQRLEFSGTPLVEVAEEFNRYNHRQLILKSAELEDIRISGTFSSSNPAALVSFLRMQAGVQVSELSNEIIVSRQ